MALTDHDIIRVSGEYEPTIVQSLNMDGMELISLNAVSKCANLMDISLARNLLHDLRPLSGLKELKSIDATRNRIASLEDIHDLKKLTTLRVAGNPLPTTFLTLLDQIKGLTSLETLEIATKELPYKGEVNEELLRTRFPRLKSFNGRRLEFSELLKPRPDNPPPRLETDEDLANLELLRIMDTSKQQKQDKEFADCMAECSSLAEAIKQELNTNTVTAGQGKTA